MEIRCNSGRAALIALGIVSLSSSLRADPTVLHTLAIFDGSIEGLYPNAGLAADGNGNLYGTTALGGTFEGQVGGTRNNLDGTIFKIDTAGEFSTVARFYGGNGGQPSAPMIIDSSGNLYGTTFQGGAISPSQNGFGTIFKFSPAGAISTLAVFNTTNNPSNGQYPLSGLTRGFGGNLYGTTSGGGTNDTGTVFQLSPVGTLSTLVSFTPPNGANPLGGLIADSSGVFLTGTTRSGGASGNGTIFRANAAGGVITRASFDGTNGSSPRAPLIADAGGNLYGTTYAGGANGVGTVFKLSTANTISVLANFDTAHGANPLGGLLADAAGDLFGTTNQGGANGYGTVFELSAAGTLTTLVDFDINNGAYPSGELIADAVGNLYGTTAGGGGPNGNGTVFELTNAGFVVPEPTTLLAAAISIATTAATRRRRSNR